MIKEKLGPPFAVFLRAVILTDSPGIGCAGWSSVGGGAEWGIAAASLLFDLAWPVRRVMDAAGAKLSVASKGLL